MLKDAYRFPAVVAASMAFGAVIAAGLHPDWQVSVENGQVLAGIVAYPEHHPYRYYLVKLWSLLNQASAALLLSGMSEELLSLVLVAAGGALSFGGITAIVYAVGGDALVALVAPLAIWKHGLSGIGSVYPIYLMGTPHTFSVIGSAWILFTAGMIANERYRAGFLMAGMAPAVHPSMGGITLVILAVLAIGRYRNDGDGARTMLRWMGAGAVASAASLGVQMWLAARLPDVGPVDSHAYLDAFVQNFDYHRNTVNLNRDGLVVAAAGVAVSAMLRRRAARGVAMLSSFVIAAAVAGVAIEIVGNRILDLPFAATLMPLRYLNFPAAMLMPLAIGVLAGRTGLAAAVAYVAAMILALVITQPAPDAPAAVYLAAAAVSVVTLVTRPGLPDSIVVRAVKAAAAAVLLVALLASAGGPAVKSLASGRSHDMMLNEDDARFRSVLSKRRGAIIAAGDMMLIQVTTRRPVVLTGGALDFFSYFPETGPWVNRILRDVYCLDLFARPRPEHANKGSLMAGMHRACWESRTNAEWRILGSSYGATDVIAPPDWNLALPVVLRQNDVIIYEIAPM